MTSIRKAELTDLPFILSLSKDSFCQYGRYDLSVSKWFLTPGTYTFILKRETKDKTRCGFIMFGVMRPGREEKAVLEIMAIAVRKECRRQGIATELIEFAKGFREQLTAGGKPLKIRLSVAETNESGRSFFQKCGFRVIAEAPWRYPAGQKALRMEL